jgi:tRNA(Ile)-lysidine synthase
LVNLKTALVLVVGETSQLKAGQLTASVARSWETASKPKKIAVALSGGRDSMALLFALHQLRSHQPIELLAFVIDHQLQALSLQWVQFCAQQCQRLGVACYSVSVSVVNQKKTGLEAAARQARYAALTQLALHHGVDAVALGHHQNDQVETVLLQTARGSGLAGRAGMPEQMQRGGVNWWRPFLRQISRADINEFVQANDIAFVDDPSNANLTLRRNAIRHIVLPQLERQTHGVVGNIAQSSLQAQAAWQQEQKLASALRAQCGQDSHLLLLAQLKQLSHADQLLVLRYWIAQLGLRAPTRARLLQMRSQLIDSAKEAKPSINHEGLVFERSEDGRYACVSTHHRAPPVAAPQVKWREAQATELGFDPTWVLHFRVQPRSGSEQIKLVDKRHARSIKQWCQERRIPIGQRLSMQVVWHQEQAVWVSGLGFDVRYCQSEGSRLVPYLA